MIRLSSLGNLLLGALLATILTYLTLTLPHEPEDLILLHRPVEFKFGSTVTISMPGQEKQAYFKWCDDGYILFSNGFKEDSPITAIRDPRCDKVR